MLLYACSSNRGKLREFSLAAAEWGAGKVHVEALPNLATIAPPEENGTSYEENAALKAVYYSRYTAEYVLSDDSGLEVAALDGAPGLYSARYSGVEANAQSNNELLLRNLHGSEDRSAKFVCVAALARSGAHVISFRGEVEGNILPAPRGQQGFGYDPLFFYGPLARSFGELDDVEKLPLSARGKALRSLFDYLESAAPPIRYESAPVLTPQPHDKGY